MSEAVEKMTRQMLQGEPLSSVAAMAAAAPEWARAFVAAAERRVRELDGALVGAREDIGKLRSRAEVFVAENEELHLRLTEAVGKQSEDPLGMGGAVGHKLLEPRGEQARELAERVEILMAENALMVDQAATLQAELDRVGGEYAGAAEHGARVEAELGRVAARAEALEKAEGGRREAHGRLEKRYVEHGAEVAAANSQLNELKEGLAALHGQNAALRDRLDDKTRACGELSARLEADGDELWSRVQAAAGRCRELSEELAATTQRADAEAERSRRCGRDLETVRNDNAGMLRVMGGMEKQLAAYAAREESVAAVGRDAKEKAENALLARDKATARADAAQRELERIRAERLADAENLEALRREAAASERRRLEAVVAERERELRSRDEASAEHEASAERASRDADRYRKQAEACSAALSRAEAAATGAVEALEKRCAAADRAAADAVERARRAERGNRAEDDHAAAAALRAGEATAEELSLLRAENEALKSSSKERAGDVANRDRDLARATRSLDEERSARARERDAADRTRSEETNRLEAALAASRRATEEAQHAFSAASERHRTALAKLAHDRDGALADATNRLKEERALVAKLAAYERELEVKAAAADADLKAQKDYAVALAERCATAERRASEAALALSKSIAEQDLLIKRYARSAKPDPPLAE